MEKERIETAILPLLNYVGIIGAVITCIAYIGIVMVMILGFSAGKSTSQRILFSVVNGVIGFMITQLLKVQGTIFAESIPENKELVKEYLNTPTKERKLRNINYFWITSVTKDVVTKLLTFSISTFAVIYIAVEGSKDVTLIWLAVVNLLMFICFGLLGLNKAYNFYNGEYMAYIREQIRRSKEPKPEPQVIVPVVIETPSKIEPTDAQTISQEEKEEV